MPGNLSCCLMFFDPGFPSKMNSENLTELIKTTSEHPTDNNSKEENVAKMLPNLQLNDNKAGMNGLDTQRINEIIQETSRGSNYYNHQLRRQKRIDQKIQEMKEKLESFSQAQINEANKKMDELLEKLETHRDLSQTVVHVDMDAFYAAVEMRDDPTLRDKPMAVGSQSMLSTSNYVARRYGIRAAMPGFIGLKLCPDLIIIPLNFKKYNEASKEIQSVLREYDEDLAVMSLDEAYLNITTHISKVNEGRNIDEYKNSEQIVQEMREKIQAKTQLTASAGIACSSMLAKICSDRNKPNGQFYLPPDRKKINGFLFALPVRKVCGIGSQTEQLLKALDVVTCGDFYKYRGIISLLFSSIATTRFMEISLGLGSTFFKNDESRKSMSVERTFNDTNNVAKLHQWCYNLCEDLVHDLDKERLLGKTVTLKLKTSEFDVRTRAFTLTEPTANFQIIYDVGIKLLDKELNSSPQKPLKLRLMGMRMSSLVSRDENFKTCQRNIISFLQHNSKENESGQEQFYCPICNELFHNLHLLNNHLDDCLMSTEFCDKAEKPFNIKKQEIQDQSADMSNSGETIYSNENTSIKDDCNVSTTTEQFVKVCESFPTVSRIQQNDSHPLSVSVHFNDNCSIKTPITCPVCNKHQLSDDDQEINQHIDVCLNKGTVSDLLRTKNPPLKRTQSDLKQTIKRPKTGFSKIKTIETFFPKIT